MKGLNTISWVLSNTFLKLSNSKIKPSSLKFDIVSPANVCRMTELTVSGRTDPHPP